MTATTRSQPQPDDSLPHVRASDADVLERIGKTFQPGMALRATGLAGDDGRLRPLSGETVEYIAGLHPGLTVVDCDGARGRAFKAPGDQEPVIPACATHVIACVGLAVLGQPLTDEHVHRAERVPGLAPCVLGELVTADLIVEVLTHELGGRKNVPPGARLSVLLSDPPTREHERLGQHIAERVVYTGFHRGVVANVGSPEQVLAVVR